MAAMRARARSPADAARTRAGASAGQVPCRRGVRCQSVPDGAGAARAARDHAPAGQSDAAWAPAALRAWKVRCRRSQSRERVRQAASPAPAAAAAAAAAAAQRRRHPTAAPPGAARAARRAEEARARAAEARRAEVAAPLPERHARPPQTVRRLRGASGAAPAWREAVQRCASAAVALLPVGGETRTS
jgi:hypothetical protein